MELSARILNLKDSEKHAQTKKYISIILAICISLGSLILHIFSPEFVDEPSVVLCSLLAVGLLSWAAGYKAGIIASFVLVVVMHIPFPISVPGLLSYDVPTMLSSLLFIIEGVLVSLITDAAKRQEKILLYKAREQTFKKKIADLIAENLNYKKEIKTRDEFLSIASHELKTPLTSMLLQTQTALHNIKNVSLAHFSIESLLKMLESVELQTRRLSKMINELFNVSIMTTGNLQLEREKTDLNQLTQDILNDFEERIKRDGYIVTFTPEGKLVGDWDKVRIAQTIANLLSNAIKYGNKKPIEIRTKKKHNFAEFVMEDRGIGISKAKQREIFGLFERADRSGDIKGLGVGLYISRQIVEAHAGSLVVASKLGSGTSFIMRLPLTEEKPTPSGATRVEN